MPPPQNLATHGTPASARFLTTLLACCWGLSSAYVLFHSLLVTHDARPCFAALVPLVIVWATLERKRWGRLALLGLSGTALGLFVAAIGYIAAVGSAELSTAERTLSNYVQIALRLYDNDPSTVLTILLLAATTGLWLRRPVVIAEFERGKRATLAAAQRAIAMLLVGSWGLTLIFTPLPTGGKNAAAKSADKHATSHSVSRSRRSSYRSNRTPRANKRASRSAASAIST
ncbi:MAG TPA: hypothetical protein VFB38_07755 [Chthonomonadaceae bacterium]|nr:hypothetical protein [Chthonomonadaceae bacterium]